MTLRGLPLVLQAALGDGVAFDPFSLQQDYLAASAVDFGFADLAVAITLGMIISPGPFQLIVPNGPSIGLDGYPNVLTPCPYRKPKTADRDRESADIRSR